MRDMRMLIVMTAMVFVAAGSARGIASPEPPMLNRTAMAASRLSSLPVVKGDESLSKTIFLVAQESTVAQLFVAATAGDGEKNPPPRSTHCPPDKDDHHDINYRDDDHKAGDNQNRNKDKDKDKDKDHHDNCGKGDDGKNP